MAPTPTTTRSRIGTAGPAQDRLGPPGPAWARP